MPTWGWSAFGTRIEPSLCWKFSISVSSARAIEIAVPFAIFVGRRSRIAACLALVFLQLTICWTGNYGFFNLLTAVLCIPLLDDAFVARWLPGRLRPAAVFQERPDFTEYPWITLRRPPDHQALGASVPEHFGSFFRGNDIAVGEDRYVHRVADVADGLVLGLALEPVGPGAPVHGERCDAFLLRHAGDFHAIAFLRLRSRADLERDRHVDLGHDGRQDCAHLVRVR